MAITEQVRQKYLGLLSSVGRAGVNTLFPNDFEYYACSLELVNSKGKIVDMLVFPVMPDSIVENKVSISNVKKTAYGVVSFFNPSFVPFDINISGSFGRKLRVLLGSGVAAFGGVNFKPSGALSVAEYSPPIFNTRIKTGYGVIKILENIYKRSFQLDDSGLPHKLFFNNLALNSNYLIEFKNLSLSQNRATNMIWNYQASFRTLAPAYQIRKNTKMSTVALVGFSALNKELTKTVDAYKPLREERNESEV